MPLTTFSARNVWIYEGPTGHCVAGFRQRGSTTNTETYFYLGICLSSPQQDEYCLVNSKSQRIERNGDVTPPGHYWIASVDEPRSYPSVTLSTEEVRPRGLSTGSPYSQSESIFVDRVRMRDGVCVVTGNDRRNMSFIGQDACHIIPMSHSAFWSKNDMQKHLTDNWGEQGPAHMRSVQNGVLLDQTIHAQWDSWAISIHPDTRMIRVFADCPESIYDGRAAQIGNLKDHPEPPREILYEHFKQCVLTNVRGAGTVTVQDVDSDEHALRMNVFEKASVTMKAASA